MKRMFTFFLAIFISTIILNAQGYEPEKMWIGPTLGYVYNGLGYGANFEYGLTDNIGLGGDIGYSTFSLDINNMISGPGFGEMPKWNMSIFSLLVTGSYHFTPNKKFDPFVKLGLGYFNWSANVVWPSSYPEQMRQTVFAPYSSGIGYVGQLGARYHFDDQWSARAGIGYPFYFSAGIDIAFGGKPSRKHKEQIKKTEEPASEPEVVKNEDNEEPKAITEIKKERPSKDAYNIWVGPYLGLNGTLNTAIGHGFLPKPGFNGPDIGASVIVPFGKNLPFGVMLDLGYTQNIYSTTLISSLSVGSNEDFTIKETYGYFAIQPSLYVAGLTVGFGFDIPVSASALDQDGKAYTIIKDTKDSIRYWAPNIPRDTLKIPVGPDADILKYLATRVDFRIGGTIHLINDENGMLNLNLHATYNLSGLYNKASNYYFAYEYDKNDVQKPTASTSLNATPVTLTLGVSYLFNLKF